jgi:hypothetical protein
LLLAFDSSHSKPFSIVSGDQASAVNWPQLYKRVVPQPKMVAVYAPTPGYSNKRD